MERKLVEQMLEGQATSKPARLDRRLSLTPPISVDSLSADTHKAIGLNTISSAIKATKVKSGVVNM